MRLYLAVTFWGDEYRRYLCDCCLASLLAPGNIPDISDKACARLLIATTDRDWALLQSEPAFDAVQSLIAIEHLPFSGTSDAQGRRMFAMSEGHRLLARKMFADHAQNVLFRHSRDRFRQMSEVDVVVNHYGVTLKSIFSDSVVSDFCSI